MAEILNNKLIITFPDNDEADITEDNIVSESMRITQSICDEDYLKFGGCIASEFKIELLNTEDRAFTQSLVGKWISVKLTQRTLSNRVIYPSTALYPSETLYPGYETDAEDYYIFSGIIDSAKMSENDMNVRTIIAYDALSLLHNSDATNYAYRTFLNSGSGGTGSIGYILSGILSETSNGIIDITEDKWVSASYNRFLNDYYTYGNNRRRVNSFTVVNSSWNNNDSKISFGKLLRNLCEIIATFGVMIPDPGKGKFKMIDLSGSPRIYSFYEKLQPEEYIATGYTDFKFNIYTGNTARNGKNTLNGGLTYANDYAIDKYYDFTDNMLINQPYNFDSSAQRRTGTEFDSLINSSSIGARLAMNPENGDCAFDSFRPLKATVEGAPEQIIGSPITIIANKTNPDGSYIYENGEPVKEEINTYIFKRTLSGIQALTDEIEVKGRM